jgi:hypothetical protein
MHFGAIRTGRLSASSQSTSASAIRVGGQFQHAPASAERRHIGQAGLAIAHQIVQIEARLASLMPPATLAAFHRQHDALRPGFAEMIDLILAPVLARITPAQSAPARATAAACEASRRFST